MALTLDQLKAAFKSNSEGGQNLPNNYYPFWNMKDGEQATIRFLPDVNGDNPLGFLVEKLSHTLVINGDKRKVPCLKMYGEDCPICKVSSAYYKDNDKTNGKKYWRQKQHVAQAIILEDPLPPDAETGENYEGKVKLLALGYQLFNVIKEEFESGELDDMPFLFEGGTNFIIKKSRQGEYSTYAVGSRFARKSSDLDEDQIALAQESMIDLSTILPQKPELEKVEGMLEAALSGGTYTEADSSDSSDDAPAPRKEKKGKVTSMPGSDDDDTPPWEESEETPKTDAKAAKNEEAIDDEADEILAQIRNRRKKK